MSNEQEAKGLGEVSFLGDIPVEVVIELGRTKMVLRDLAALDMDDVVELDQPMDKPLDVVVGGKLIARGELVMVGDRMALRVTDLVATSGESEP
jgi:flagellar motor switch protein FliN/FliY